MIILRAHKTELDPNNAQKTSLLNHAGARRWAYNWGLRRKMEEYEKTKSRPSAIDLHKELNRLKKTEIPWMYEVSKCAPQEALQDLDDAYSRFFANIKAGRKPGFPRFKSKKHGIGGFRLTGVIRVFDRYIQLPRLGRVRLKERGYLPVDDPKIRILSATIKERAGRWFVSLQVEEEIQNPIPKKQIGGIDVGISALATLSDGKKFENPRTLAQVERKIKHLQRVVSRKKKGSQNRKKAVHKLAKLHAHVANIRSNVLNEISSAIAKRYGIIGMEDLNLDGMGRNHCLAKALKDAALGELSRQVAYKMEWSGGHVVLADRFFPSTKRCSRCHVVKEEMGLSERIFHCDACGLTMDRDENAAVNLEQVAASESETLNACGENVRPRVGRRISRKQEPNAVIRPRPKRVSFGKRKMEDLVETVRLHGVSDRAYHNFSRYESS